MRALVKIVIIGSLLILLMALFMRCVTVQPVPDTRPKNNYHQLARQAELITNSRQ